MDNNTNDDLVDAAITFYLRSRARSGDTTADLAKAARTAMQMRADNSTHGGVVLAALYARVKSWRTVESLTGIPVRSARRWATPPDQSATETDTSADN